MKTYQPLAQQEQYVNSVLKTWLDLNYHDPSVPVPTLLWNNSHIKYQGNVYGVDNWENIVCKRH